MLTESQVVARGAESVGPSRAAVRPRTHSHSKVEAPRFAGGSLFRSG